MNNEEILKKAIEKALSNGFNSWWTPYLKTKNGIKVKLKYKETLEGLAIQFTDKGDESWDLYSKGGLLDWSNGYVFSVVPAKYIIFSHDFAKAFWGEIEYTHAPNGEIDGYKNTGWKNHLGRMVLEEDPVKYLEKFL